MSSFEGLYTFADVASMYNIDQSTLRHNVGTRFVDAEDVKKLGKTWIVREFGFIPQNNDKDPNVRKKPGRKSTFDKCKEAYLNGEIK